MPVNPRSTYGPMVYSHFGVKVHKGSFWVHEPVSWVKGSGSKRLYIGADREPDEPEPTNLAYHYPLIDGLNFI